MDSKFRPRREGAIGRSMGQLSELCGTIDELLRENELVFTSFGPLSEYAQWGFEPGAAAVWHQQIEKIILPNNSRIVELLEQYRDLVTGDPDLLELADQFIRHSLSYAAFVEDPNEGHQDFLFPGRFPAHVREVAAGTKGP